MNGQRGREERSQILRSGFGSSGKTFAAVMHFANKAKPRVMILENVDELEDRVGVNNANLDFLYAALSAVGYSVSQKTLVSSRFALP